MDKVWFAIGACLGVGLGAGGLWVFFMWVFARDRH